MKALKRLVDRCLTVWLRPVVDLGEPTSRPPLANPQRRSLQFMILTPQIEQTLDASA